MVMGGIVFESGVDKWSIGGLQGFGLWPGSSVGRAGD